MMRLLVLGAGGMLGSATIRQAVRHGYDVHALLRPTTEPQRLAEVEQALICHRLDLADCRGVGALVERLSPQAIVHAAFPGGVPEISETRASMLQNGLTASLNLLEILRRVRFDGALVHLGSAMSYGPTGKPHHPADPMRPVTFRGAVKAAESLMIGQFARETACVAIELRVFNAYGPWEHRERLLSRLFVAALRGRRIALTPIPHFRDYVYVDDVAEACLLACHFTTPGGAVFNVCSGKVHSNHEFARAVEDLTGLQLVHSLSYHKQDTYGDPEPIGVLPRPEEGFAWCPRHDLQSGLEASWSWARSNAGSSYLLPEGP
jgi:nucleoside-diphosphate-sugar epimerase